MEFVRFSYHAGSPTGGRLVATGDIPQGWWGMGEVESLYQSWERPFMLSVLASERQDGTGTSMSMDTGEAFSWFVRASYGDTLRQSQNLGAAGDMLSSLLGGLGTNPLDELLARPIPTPENGRPERRFVSVLAYLEEQAVAAVAPPDGTPSPRLELAGFGTVGEDDGQATARERQSAIDAAPSWRDVGIDGMALRLNAVLDRTAMGHWRFVSPDGIPTHLFLGARMSGRDILCFDGHAPYGIQPNTWEFGKASCQGLAYYEVDWMATRRFAGLIREGAGDIEDFRRALVRFAATTKFSDDLMGEMASERSRLSQASSEERQREIERLRALSHRLFDQSRHEDAERVEQERQRLARQQHDDARRIEQAERDARERRIREGWSMATRGVSQYVDPYGRRIEVPTGGVNQKAYWDHSTGRVVTADIPDVDKPFEWEELRPWP